MVNPNHWSRLAYLHEEGVTIRQFAHSDRAHVHPPYHIDWSVSKKSLKGDNKIGTMIKGWPAYMDKAQRGNPDCGPFGPRRVFAGTPSVSTSEEKNRSISKLYDAEALSFDDIFEEYYEYGQQIKQYVIRYFCHLERCFG